MSDRLNKVLEGFDLDQIELEDEGFLDTDYEIEVYYDIYEWHPSGNYRTNDITYAGSAVSPVPYFDEDENLDVDKFISAIRREIQKALDDEDRVGPVYVAA